MRRLALALCLLLLPTMLLAQVVPPGGGGGGPVTLPGTTCVNQVGIGLSPSGVLQCGPVLPAMAPGLVPSGGDVNATGQVLSTHLPSPLPVVQGGSGLSAGTPGGLLYFSGPTALASSPAFTLGAPLMGGGPGQPPQAGTRSGTTPEFATVSGPHVLDKQLTFDANGNIVASTTDIGGVPAVIGIAQGGLGWTDTTFTGTLHRLATSQSLIPGRCVSVDPSGNLQAAAAPCGDMSGLNAVTAAAPFTAGHLIQAAGNDRTASDSGVALGTLCTTTSVCAGYQASLGFTPEAVTNKASSATLGTSNVLYPTQAAVKTYVDTGLATKQATLGFTPEDSANKSNAALGTSATLFPTQQAVKSYVDTGLGTKQASLGFTPEDSANKSNTALGTSGTLFPTQAAVKTYVDAGLATKQATLAFTPEDSANKSNAALGTSATLFPTQGAVKTYVDTGLAGKQATLTFTPEDSANKSNGALGTSTTLFPTQGAVKTYVDSGLAGKQDTVTWGAGLRLTAGVASVDSTEAGFLTNGAATPLTCGVSQQGRMQVMGDGTLQYCDGATPAVLQSGRLTPAPLKWNVTASVCTSDANGGKLSLNASNEIVCAGDIAGTGGPGGSVNSVFGRTGTVTAQPGDYSAPQVTNAADVTAANTFTNASGQSMRQLLLLGSTSGALTISTPATASGTLTLPAGTTNFTTTGGVGQVVRQASVGAPLTVGALSAGDLTNSTTGSGPVVLQNAPSITQLANLTSNGLVRTSGGNGTLSVDTTPYLTANQSITLTGDASGTGSTSIPVTVTRIGGTAFAGTSGNVVSFGASNTPADSGVPAAQLSTAAAAFTSGHLIQAAGNNRTLADSGVAVANLCTTAGVCTGYQGALGYTAVPDTRTLTIAGTTNQVLVSLAGPQNLTANRSWTLSLPQNIDTAAQVRYASLGLGAAPPSGSGQLAITGGANNMTLTLLKRFTDTSPLGVFEDFQSAAGSSLWQVDITGTLTAGFVPTTRLTGTLTNAQLPATLSAKRVDPRVVALPDAATITLNTDAMDEGVATALSQDTTFAVSASATPQPGNQIRVAVTSTVPRLITWNPTYFSAAAGLPLPATTTGGGGWDEWGFEWNAALGKWLFIGTTQSSQSSRRRTCTILIGSDNGVALVDADLGPQLNQCEIASLATLEQITIVATGGTPSVLVHRRTDTTNTAVLTTALATGASGAAACARTTATAGYRSTMTCSATLQNTTLSPGDWIGLSSGSATGSPARVTISVSYLLNG